MFLLGHYIYAYKRDWKKKAGDPGQWPQSKKTEAVLTWLTTGNMSQTSVMLGVPLQTLNLWKRSTWWKDIVDGIHDDDKVELDAKYQKIIRKALTVVDDRLENGNFMMDQKTGQIVRVPVNMADTHRVMKDLVDQQLTLRIDKKTEEINLETVNDKLKKLAEQFQTMAGGGKKLLKVGQIYEVEGETDAVHDQRKEGHSQGEQAVQFQAGAEEEQSTTEQST